MSISGKPAGPPTPPDSAPATPGLGKNHALEDPVPVQPNGSKRWTRSFTSSTKPIPRPSALPLQLNSPVAAPILIPIPPIDALAKAFKIDADDPDALVKVFKIVDERQVLHSKLLRRSMALTTYVQIRETLSSRSL